MAPDYGCILVAALLPCVWIAIAKAAAPADTSKDPRSWLARQDSRRVRNANAAHLNAFEVFPAFDVGVPMAPFAGVAPPRSGLLAVAFVGLRVLYGVSCPGDAHLLRSLAPVGGFACVLSLMASTALRVAGAA